MKAIASCLRHALTIQHSGILSATLCGLLLTPAIAQDVGFVAVLKGQEFYQISEDIASLGEWRTWHETGEILHEGEHSEPPHVFEVYVVGTAPGAILAGSCSVPGGEVVPLEDEFLGDVDVSEMGVENAFLTALDLDTARPDGSYTVHLQTLNDGPLHIPLALTGSAHPPVPHVTNFTALQNANAGAPITIQWSAMGGTATDFIQVKVMEAGGMDAGTIVWESAMPGQPGALDGTATEVTILTGELDSGSDYHAEVLFVKTVDVKQQPVAPALSVAGYYKLTGFRLRTAALPGTALGAEFVRANPPVGWWVPQNAAVAFHFSHPMNPAYQSITWRNNGTTPFEYHWTQNDTVLICKPTTNLPGNRDILWTLNLSGFRDAAGSFLSGTKSGFFHTENYVASIPPDVDFLGLFKTRSFRQTGTAPVPEGRYESVVEMDANAPNRLLSASVTSQENGRVSPLFADPWNGDEYEAPGEYASKTDLDRFYPNGIYQVSLNGLADGMQDVTVNLGEGDQYPDAPVIANLAAIQNVKPDQDITVSWQELPGWTNDFETLESGAGLVEFEIIDSNTGWDVFWVEADEMVDGVSCVIPAGTLEPGRSYEARVLFMRIADLQFTESGSTAVAAFESQTVFTIQTGGQPELPELTLQRIDTFARINATGGIPNISYVLETSGDLSRWTLLNVYWSPEQGSTYQFDDTDARYLKSRFYRVGEYLPGNPTQPPISIQGTVWTDSSHTTPVAGATVGTSLDSRTTTTDAQGRFFLITDTPSMGGSASYTIHITSGAVQRSFGPWSWGDQPRDQIFDMN